MHCGGCRFGSFPVSCTCCGLSALLSVITSVATYGPAAVGLKLTVIEQEAPGASALAQVFVWEKTERKAGLPVIPMLLIVRLGVPVLVNIICIELTTLVGTRPNSSLAGARMFRILASAPENATAVPVP